MWFISLMIMFASIIQLLFVVVSIAAGLYYLAELVEEYTVASRKIIFWMCIVDLIVYLGLAMFEDFPAMVIITGIVSQFMHIMILSTFPVVELSSLSFISAIILFFINHYLAFSFFNENYYTFYEVLSFFTICLWLVPFALFVSLSANENVLPTRSESSPLLGDDDVVSNYFSKQGKKYGLRTFFKYAQETLLPYQNKKSF